MSSERWWWANKAQELRYHQLESARKQAESWRTGLTGLTALFGAVLIVKGRDNVAALPSPFPYLVVALLAAGLTALVAATLLALRAASGTPGDHCLLTGEDLEAWSRREVLSIQRSIVVGRRLMLCGITLIAVAIGLAWLAPAQRGSGSINVVVDAGGGTICGTLTGIGDGALVLRRAGRDHVVPQQSVVELRSVGQCP